MISSSSGNASNPNPDPIRLGSHCLIAFPQICLLFLLSKDFEHICNSQYSLTRADLQASRTMEHPARRRCDNQCQQHEFMLHNPSEEKLNVAVDFCPKYHRPPRPPQSVFPSFNNDKKYYTSGFILQVDRKALALNEKQFLMEHNRHIKEALEKDVKIIFPKPSKRHTICGICKTEYSNYYKHIISEQHKEILNNNEYSRYIQLLSSSYQHHHSTASPSPIQLIQIDKPKETQPSLSPNKVNQQTMSQVDEVNNAKGAVSKEIEALIISSDEELAEETEPAKAIGCRHSSKASFDSDSSEDYSSRHSKAVTKINLQSSNDSDSVQIISVRTAKKEKKERHKIKSSKKHKHKKSKKSKKKKDKSKRKSRSNSSKEQSPQKKRGLIGKKGPSQMPQFCKPLSNKRLVNSPANRSGEVLIEKSQIDHPQRETEMQKILTKIVGGIKSSLPPHLSNKNQKMNESSEFRSAVIGGKAFSADNLSPLNSHKYASSLVGSGVSQRKLAQKEAQTDKNLSFDKKSPSFIINQKNLIINMFETIIEQHSPENWNSHLTHKVIPLVTKKQVGEGMLAYTSTVEKYIDLDCEEIVEVKATSNAKRKTELELIRLYDRKIIAKQTNQSQLSTLIASDGTAKVSTNLHTVCEKATLSTFLSSPAPKKQQSPVMPPK